MIVLATIHDIKGEAAGHFGVRIRDLESQRRHRPLVHQRQLAMYLCRQLIGDSYPVIARSFGNRDHSTVMHACKAVEQRVRNDPRWAEHAKAIAARVAERVRRRGQGEDDLYLASITLGIAPAAEAPSDRNGLVGSGEVYACVSPTSLDEPR